MIIHIVTHTCALLVPSLPNSGPLQVPRRWHLLHTHTPFPQRFGSLPSFSFTFQPTAHLEVCSGRPHTWRPTPAWDLLGFVPAMNRRPCNHSLCYLFQHTPQHPRLGHEEQVPTLGGGVGPARSPTSPVQAIPARTPFAHLRGREAHYYTYENPGTISGTGRGRPPGTPQWI